MTATDILPEARNRLDKLLRAYDLDQDTIAKVWARVVASSFSPEDPSAVVIAIETLFEERGAEIIGAINDLPGLIEQAARAAVGPVADAAALVVEAKSEENAARLDETFRTVAARGVKSIERAADQAGDALVTHMLNVGNVAMSEDRKRSAIHAASAALIVGALLFGAVGYTAFTVGHSSGRVDAIAETDTLRNILARPDAEEWIELGRYNDIAAARANYCGTGSERLVVAGDSIGCDIRLWYTQQQAGNMAGSTWEQLWRFINNPFRRYDPLALLAGGAVLAMLGSFFMKKFKRA